MARRASLRSIEVAKERGRRTYLRHMTRGDRQEFCRLYSSEHVLRWSPIPPFGDDPEPLFERSLRTTDTATRQRLLLCRRRDEAVMGNITLAMIERGPFQNAVLGYWIGEAFAGQGYSNEGVRLTLRYAFETLKLHRVEANIMPNNTPSLALVRKLGFREEGYSPRYLQIRGKWADHTRWAITVEDWKLRRGR